MCGVRLRRERVWDGSEEGGCVGWGGEGKRVSGMGVRREGE